MFPSFFTQQPVYLSCLPVPAFLFHFLFRLSISLLVLVAILSFIHTYISVPALVLPKRANPDWDPFVTLELQGFYDSFLFISNTLIPGCGISGYDWTGTCLLRQFTNLPCVLLSSFSFLTVIGGPTEAPGYFLLWSYINSEILYKRPLVSPLVTVLQTQA